MGDHGEMVRQGMVIRAKMSGDKNSQFLMIVQVESNVYKLINLGTGNRWYDAPLKKVNNGLGYEFSLDEATDIVQLQTTWEDFASFQESIPNKWENLEEMNEKQ